MATRQKKPKEIFLVRRVFINKKTGQASITIPKKQVPYLPKLVRLKIW